MPTKRVYCLSAISFARCSRRPGPGIAVPGEAGEMKLGHIAVPMQQNRSWYCRAWGGRGVETWSYSGPHAAK